MQLIFSAHYCFLFYFPYYFARHVHVGKTNRLGTWQSSYSCAGESDCVLYHLSPINVGEDGGTRNCFKQTVFYIIEKSEVNLREGRFGDDESHFSYIRAFGVCRVAGFLLHCMETVDIGEEGVRGKKPRRKHLVHCRL